MSNTQFYFALGVPFFTLLIVYFTSVVSNRAAITDLRAEMSKGFAATNTRIDDMNKGFADMLAAINTRIDDLRSDMGSRLDRIEKKQDALDSDIRIGHDHRIAVLEARVLQQAS